MLKFYAIICSRRELEHRFLGLRDFWNYLYIKSKMFKLGLSLLKSILL